MDAGNGDNTRVACTAWGLVVDTVERLASIEGLEEARGDDVSRIRFRRFQMHWLTWWSGAEGS